jgi:hypothetical protein
MRRLYRGKMGSSTYFTVGPVYDRAYSYRRALEIDPQCAPAREGLAEAERLMTTHQGQ